MTSIVKRFIYSSQILLPHLYRSQRKADEVKIRIENMIYQRQLFETQDYIDIDVRGLNGKEIENIVKHHAWISKTYLMNDNLRVFPISGSYPSLNLDYSNEDDIIVSRQGESN